MKYSLFPCIIFCVVTLSGCGFFSDSKPQICTDPIAITAHAPEKRKWESAASKVKLGMLRSKVEIYLPKNDFMDTEDPLLGQPLSSATYKKHGIVEWYYLSRHFICELTYAPTGTTSDWEVEMERDHQQKLLVLPKIVQVIRPPSKKSWW